MANEINVADVLDMYLNQNCSPYVIAKKYNTYSNKIRRILLKNNIELRDKGEAQKVALQTGRSKHPTEGMTRSEEVKYKISEGVHGHWQGLSDEDRDARAYKAKQQWDSMTEAERQNLRDAAAQAVREASKNGSKMERFLLDKLTLEGYNVIFHKTGLIINEALEIDLFIPELKTAIEIDGPAHFFPIWGDTEQKKQELLEKHIKADADKSGLLLGQGYVVIRVKHLTKSISEKNKRDVLQAILDQLSAIKKDFRQKVNDTLN